MAEGACQIQLCIPATISLGSMGALKFDDSMKNVHKFCFQKYKEQNSTEVDLESSRCPAKSQS